MGSFFIDDREMLVEVWDIQRNKMLSYKNITFDFLSDREFEDRINYDYAVKIDENQYLLSTNGNRNYYKDDFTYADYFAYNEGKVQQLFFDNKEIEGSYHHFTLFIKNLIVNDQKEIFASVDYDNTIYRFSGQDLVPFLEVSYTGGKSLDNARTSKLPSEQRVDYFRRGDLDKQQVILICL